MPWLSLVLGGDHDKIRCMTVAPFPFNRQEAVKRQQEQDALAACTFTPRTNKAKSAALLSMHSWPAAFQPVTSAAGLQPHGPGTPERRIEVPRGPHPPLLHEGAQPLAPSPSPSSPKEHTDMDMLHAAGPADVTVAAGERLYRSALRSMHRQRQQADQSVQVTHILVGTCCQQSMQARMLQRAAPCPTCLSKTSTQAVQVAQQRVD